MKKKIKYLAELKKLNFPQEQFAVFGSGPLAIRGLRDNDDLDVIVKPELWERLTKEYPLVKEALISIGKIDFFKDWKPWFNDQNKLIDEADVFEGIRFVKMERVLEWKKATNREKDKKDIKLIEEYLKCNK